MKRIYRVSKNKLIAGVCSGLSEYFNVDVTLIRLIFVALAFLEGFGILAYILCWIIIPTKEEKEAKEISFREEDVNEDEKRKVNTVIGLIFIFLGIIILLNYHFSIFKFLRFWPVILILIGLFILLKGVKNEKG